MPDPARAITLCAIVAMAKNHVIGGDNKLLWHIPEDLAHFKATTMNKPLIMGRKTFQSLPGILPGRPHIIVTRDRDGFIESLSEKRRALLGKRIFIESSITGAIETGHTIAEESGVDEVFIAGGGQLYAQTLDQIQRLYLTTVHKAYEGDTTFPEINHDAWTIISHEDHTHNDLSFTIQRLDRP